MKICRFLFILMIAAVLLSFGPLAVTAPAAEQPPAAEEEALALKLFAEERQKGVKRTPAARRTAARLMEQRIPVSYKTITRLVKRANRGNSKRCPE